MSPLLKIGIVFLGMLLLQRSKVPLGLALVAGGVAMDAWAGHGAITLAHHLGLSLLKADLWLLLLVTALLLEFGRCLGEEANARAIDQAAQRWGGRHGRAMSLMLIPAAIGLVPMPGGALVSAPLVDRALRSHAGTAEWKSAVNYWFRHVWEYWWPIYPVVVVTLGIFHLPAWQLAAALIPLTFFSFVIGFVLLVRPHLDRLAAEERVEVAEPRRIRDMAWSLALVVGSTLLLPAPLQRICPGVDAQITKLLAMAAGMVAGLVLLLCREGGARTARIFAELARGRSVQQLVTLGGVMIFQSMLEFSGLLPAAGRELAASGIPASLVVAILPFVAGLVTGVAAAFAGMAFPLVVGLMEGGAGGLTPVAALILAFGFGYAGMMLSPVHLCLVLTRNYFTAHLPGIYRYLLPGQTLMLAATVGLYGLARAMGW